MTIDLVCIDCGAPQAAHNLGSRCSNGDRSRGFMLLDSHALDDVPPARRALERARLAQQRHPQKHDVQLILSSDGASGLPETHDPPHGAPQFIDRTGASDV